MPIGTNGSAMLLLSGGIDSPVAGYMIAKRGVEIEATYFAALRDGNNVQTAKIVSSIRELNRMIEELDDKLGGIILSEK